MGAKSSKLYILCVRRGNAAEEYLNNGHQGMGYDKC